MLVIIRGIALLLMLCAGFARAADSGWMESPQNDHAQIRLQAEKDHDQIHVLLTIDLAPNWKTYWRSPGEGGVAPSILWQDRVKAQWFWPVPSRFDISGLTTQGYHNHVIIPMVIKRNDLDVLAGKLTLSTCSNVCMLTDYSFRLDFNQPADPDFASNFAQAMRAIPDDKGVSEHLAAYADGGTLHIQAERKGGWNKPDIFIDPLKNGVTPGKPDFSINGNLLNISVPVTDEWGDAPGDLTGETLSFVLTNDGKAQQSEILLADKPSLHVRPGAGTKPSSPALWTILLFALAGGLILNLMPCVLPVLGMKLGAVLHAGADKNKIRVRFLATTAGIICSFAILATGMTVLKLSNAALGWGIQFQNVWFIGLMVLVTFIFSLNFFGLFELLLPSGVVNRMATAGGSGVLGSFCEGIFATLLATPCTAPFLGTAVAFALAAPLPQLWLVFLILGIGMSLPWLAISAFPQVAKILPRPGKWMNSLRSMLGLLMFGSSIWLVSLLRGHVGIIPATGLSIAMSLLVIATLIPRGELSKWGKGVVVTALGIFIGLQIGFLQNDKNENETQGHQRTGQIHWQPLSEDAIASALAQHKRVFIDITADWCVTCKVNEHRALSQPEVIAALNQPDVVALRGDWSQPSDAIAQFLHRRNSFAIPFNQVYGPAEANGKVLPPLLNVQTVIHSLDEAK